MKQRQQLLLIKNQKREGGGDFISDRARERKLRGLRDEKERVTECVDERGEGNREERRGGRGWG